MYNIIQEFNNKRVGIVGFGIEGESSLKFLQLYCKPKSITIYDVDIERNKLPKNIECKTGRNYLDDINEDIIIKTPSILSSIKQLIDFKNKKGRIESQASLFLKYFHKQTIGITGTKGKSTTTSIIYHVLNKANKDVLSLGNIGVPFFDHLSKITKDTICVVELSSYQLRDVEFSPHIAVIQNISKAHLDVHPSYRDYYESKLNIIRYQSPKDSVIFNERNKKLVKKISSFIGKKETFSIKQTKFNKFKSNLEGDFNKTNIIPAIIIAKKFKIKDETIQSALLSFKPLSHRIEHIGIFNGIDFVDDSIGTVVDSTIQAIKTFSSISILITGGYDNGQDYKRLATIIQKSKIKLLILFPPTGLIIKSHLNKLNSDKKMLVASSMEEAVRFVYNSGINTGICLLGCASPSFGMFKNYIDRAEQFKHWVKKLAK